MQRVQIKGTDEVLGFPDGMSDDEMRAAILAEVARNQAMPPSQMLQSAMNAPNQLQPYDRSISERIKYGIGDALQNSGLISNNQAAYQIGGNFGMGVEALPVVGESADLDDLKRSYEQGDGLGMLLAGAGLIPVVGEGVKRGGRAIRESIEPNITNINAFKKMTKDDFLGNPKITSNANAANLRPKELSTLENLEKRPFLDGKYKFKSNEDGAVVFDGDKPIASYNFGSNLVVDKKYRRKGIGEELVYQWRVQNPTAKPATERTKASQRLQEKVWDRIQKEIN